MTTENIISHPQKTESVAISIDPFYHELQEIALWWSTHAIDNTNGGFYGEISSNSVVNAAAHKGIILNTRILWFFSEYAFYTQDAKCFAIAERAYRYICRYFLDTTNGGVLWELDAKGNCLNGRKQIYAQAFAIYAFSAYFKLTRNKEALQYAYDIFSLIENNGFDHHNGGYFEAFNQEWGPLEDIRLSEKDLNAPKTMNTHLHILEAYTALYSVDNDTKVQTALKGLLGYYGKFFVNQDQRHVKMFLDMEWRDQSLAFSYGHDIESSWLIWEAAETLNDPEILNYFKPLVINLANTCLEVGIANDGSVMDIYDFDSQTNQKERVWWVQAEALVGFYNAYQLTHNKDFLVAIDNIWTFIQKHQKDLTHGEWHWLALPDQGSNYTIYKSGFWKGPYHNGRAMLELCRRLSH